jgi:hypothetical protein
MALPEDIIARVREDFDEDDGLLVLQELWETNRRSSRKYEK